MLTRKTLAIISVDQMKTFDQVSHTFLLKMLQHFGFGPNFIQWIHLIYDSASVSIKVNGWLNAFINLERGARQTLKQKLNSPNLLTIHLPW